MRAGEAAGTVGRRPQDSPSPVAYRPVFRLRRNARSCERAYVHTHGDLANASHLAGTLTLRQDFVVLSDSSTINGERPQGATHISGRAGVSGWSEGATDIYCPSPKSSSFGAWLRRSDSGGSSLQFSPNMMRRYSSMSAGPKNSQPSNEMGAGGNSTSAG